MAYLLVGFWHFKTVKYAQISSKKPANAGFLLDAEINFKSEVLKNEALKSYFKNIFLNSSKLRF